jgi:hypothetical protein
MKMWMKIMVCVVLCVCVCGCSCNNIPVIFEMSTPIGPVYAVVYVSKPALVVKKEL